MFLDGCQGDVKEHLTPYLGFNAEPLNIYIVRVLAAGPEPSRVEELFDEEGRHGGPGWRYGVRAYNFLHIRVLRVGCIGLIGSAASNATMVAYVD